MIVGWNEWLTIHTLIILIQLTLSQSPVRILSLNNDAAGFSNLHPVSFIKVFTVLLLKKNKYDVYSKKENALVGVLHYITRRLNEIH